jgi:hypothetical protein
VKKTSIIIFLVILNLLFTTEIFAMSSAIYKIGTDSVNTGGTENSTDGSTTLSDTIGEFVIGPSTSTSYSISAGYRTMQSSYISITAAGGVGIPNIGGLGGEESLASSSWVVKTDNFAGYELYVRASTSPALQSSNGAYFSDYVPAGSAPDYQFVVAPTSSAFGFSPEGFDTPQRFLNDGVNCDTGSFNTEDRCWDGFSTSNKTVSHRTTSNHPAGTETTLNYEVGIGINKIQDSGAYSANIIVTAVTL